MTTIERNKCTTRLKNSLLCLYQPQTYQERDFLNNTFQSCLIIPHYFRRRITSISTYFLILLLVYFTLYHSLVTRQTTISNQTKSTPTVRIMYLVRTNTKFYETRLIYLLQTWISLVHHDVYFVTDKVLPNISHRHLILTRERCGPEKHSMDTLCCKTAHDFLLFHRHLENYDWFCHFDDDQYVNINNLEKYLSKLDITRPYYIGRNSWVNKLDRRKEPFPYSFWFATLGAGICLSKPLVRLLQPYTFPIGRFVNGCIKENYFDDIYLGFLISAYLNITLTKNYHFHSHLEKTFYHDKEKFLKIFPEQITFGFKFPHTYPKYLPNIYKSNMDPYRIRALHCLLNLQIPECQMKLRRHAFNLTK